MGAKWSTVSTSTYADGSPSDDGSATEANRVKYATIKTDLTDPLDTAIDLIVAKLDERFDETTTAVSTNYTTVASDHATIIEITSGAVTLLAASSGGAGYRVGVYASGDYRTVNRSASDTINGLTSFIVPVNTVRWFTVNAAGDGYIADGKSACLFYAVPSANQTSVTAASETKVTFATETYDIGGNFASSSFVAPVTDTYRLSAVVQSGTNLNDGEEVIAFFSINGSADPLAGAKESSGSSDNPILNLNWEGRLTAGQSVSVYVWHNYDDAIPGGSPINLDANGPYGSMYFSGSRVA